MKIINKKNVIKIFIVSVIIFRLHLQAGWIGITKTPEIKGVVVDSTTGKPIENVLVEASWYANYLGLAPDTITGYYRHEIVITDKDGGYRIPSYTKFRLGSKFMWIDIRFIHPLYERREVRWPDIGQADRGGNVVYNLSLLSLEERYVKEFKLISENEINLYKEFKRLKSRYIGRYVSGYSEDKIKVIEKEYNDFINRNKKIVLMVENIGNLRSEIGSYENGSYFDILSNRGKSIDINEIFDKWKLYAELTSDEGLIKNVNQLVYNIKKNIKAFDK